MAPLSTKMNGTTTTVTEYKTTSDYVKPTGALSENDWDNVKIGENLGSKPTDHPSRTIVWRNVILMVYLHGAALYGLYLTVTLQAMWQTVACAFLLYIMGGLGVTMGSHRLWAHRTYKAKWPLRLLLATWQTMAFQNDIHEWSRDHRVHHKYSETDADPHDARRGFWFSHVGWLCMKKHPQVIEKGQTIDCSDLLKDPIVYFQQKFYIPLVLLCCVILPTVGPVYFWGETYWNGYFVCSMLRYAVTLNITWLVNSAAHMWGFKPYDRTIGPVENVSVAVLAVGEGWHNFHHTFPWDYKTSEFGLYKTNLSTLMIDFFWYLGLAYDLKVASPEVIQKRIQRTGDGSLKPKPKQKQKKVS